MTLVLLETIVKNYEEFGMDAKKMSMDAKEDGYGCKGRRWVWMQRKKMMMKN